MKQNSRLLLSLFVAGTLTACNSGGGQNNPTTSTNNGGGQPTESTPSNFGNSSTESLPQVNMSDVQLIFNALATDQNKTTIDMQTAVNIINGVDTQRLAILQNLNTTGYQTALNQLQQISPYPLLSNGNQAKYNEALFAAIFIGDVTDSNSGSDGTSQLGTISLANTTATIAMVSHRFFGGHRLAQQHYTWSVNPGTFTSILNNVPNVGNANDVSYLNIHQGAVGDCWLLSTIGALINQRGPQALLQNIQQNGNQITVNYTNIHSVESSITIPLPNDLQVATGAYSNGSGSWLDIYEQAFGSVLMSNEYNMVYYGNQIPTTGVYGLATFFDGMVNSNLAIGQYYPAYKFITGHEVYEFTTDYNNAGDNSFKNVSYDSDFTNVTLGQSLSNADIITLLDKAFNEKRVIVLGTPVDVAELNPGENSTGAVKLPVDVVGTHAYAVLGHSNGLFKLRNPWGTNYTPNGPDSFANGYTMKDGVFYVPDSDIFKIFTQIDIEQLPGLDSTPQIVNGQVVLNKIDGKAVMLPGTDPLMTNYVSSNNDFINQNFTSDIYKK